MTLFGCWAHARHKIFEVSKAHPSLTEAPLEFIGELYLIEKQIKKQGLEPAEASLLRQQKAGTPLMKLKHWMHKTKPKLKPKMRLHKAIEYIQKRWQKLIRYLWHGEVQIDNNLIENAIRPAALGRKSYFFAGSQDATERTALFYSLIGSCKMAGVNPLAWLTDVIKNINNHPIQKLHLLLSGNWKMQQV